MICLPSILTPDISIHEPFALDHNRVGIGPGPVSQPLNPLYRNSVYKSGIFI